MGAVVSAPMGAGIGNAGVNARLEGIGGAGTGIPVLVDRPPLGVGSRKAFPGAGAGRRGPPQSGVGSRGPVAAGGDVGPSCKGAGVLSRGAGVLSAPPVTGVG